MVGEDFGGKASRSWKECYISLDILMLQLLNVTGTISVGIKLPSRDPPQILNKTVRFYGNRTYEG